MFHIALLEPEIRSNTGNIIPPWAQHWLPVCT